MKVLITGSSGYLGGRLVQYFLENTDLSIVLAVRSNESGKKIKKKFKGKVKIVNLFSKSYLTACDSVSTVIHLAGLNSEECLSSKVRKTDIDFTKRLLESVILNKVKKLLYLSSVHVYDSPLSGVISETNDSLNLHPYAVNHTKKEKLILDVCNKSRTKAIVLRLSNSFGSPVDVNTNCWMLLINDLCKQAVTSGVMKLNAANQIRDFVTITDFCKVCRFFIIKDNDQINYNIFNLSYGKSFSVYDIANLIKARFFILYGKSVSIEHSKIDRELSNSLILENNRLSDIGYKISSFESFIDEIDGLIRFCCNNFN